MDNQKFLDWVRSPDADDEIMNILSSAYPRDFVYGLLMAYIESKFNEKAGDWWTRAAFSKDASHRPWRKVEGWDPAKNEQWLKIWKAKGWEFIYCNKPPVIHAREVVQGDFGHLFERCPVCLISWDDINRADDPIDCKNIVNGEVSKIARSPQPEPQCVWWYFCDVCRTGTERYNAWMALHQYPVSRCKNCKNHWGSRPPCDDGKHERQINTWRCRICHASLDVGASDKTMQESSNKDLPAKADRTAPKPLHQDPLRFRGHLRGCHAWRWENYERCSCWRWHAEWIAGATCLKNDNDGQRFRFAILKDRWQEPFTPRLTDWDL